ncbi:hypothetical protein SUGI_0794240 [Cryptomeria japonica]|nr:hypothetical protein SUGI_0794240 [Cryptomeria japonica]
MRREKGHSRFLTGELASSFQQKKHASLFLPPSSPPRPLDRPFLVEGAKNSGWETTRTGCRREWRRADDSVVGCPCVWKDNTLAIFGWEIIVQLDAICVKGEMIIGEIVDPSARYQGVGHTFATLRSC